VVTAFHHTYQRQWKQDFWEIAFIAISKPACDDWIEGEDESQSNSKDGEG
jgi:hypothetical protein